MEYQYDHFGVPTKYKLEGMIYYPEYKVWCSDYERDPMRIEWIFFEKECKMPSLIQNIPHVCFIVPDIQKAVRNKKILLEPIFFQDRFMTFIEENGVAIEFFQFPLQKEKVSPQF